MESIGRYRILNELKQGGLGRLYRAMDPSIPREVAIKVLNSADRDLLPRFQQEASIAGQLHHKNIVTIYDFGVERETPYLVMQLLQGCDLATRLESQSRLAIRESMEIMQQVADGLHYAHLQGVVHRDVTPANIWIQPDGTVKIIDFGISSAANSQYRITHPQDPFGTLVYLSPESFQGIEPDARADIFAYGILYYQLISGQHPFTDSNPTVVVCNIRMKHPAALTTITAECPAELDQIIQRALNKDPELRYQSLRDLALDVEPIYTAAKRGEAAVLLARVSALAAEGRREEAESLLARVRELDPENREARGMYERLQQDRNRESIRTKIDLLIRDAKGRLAGRSFTDAVQLLEKATRLDPENQAAQAELRQAREALSRHQKVVYLIQAAKERLQQGNLTEAEGYLLEAAGLDPSDPGSRVLLENIRRQREQAAEQRRRAALTAGKQLLAEEKFEEAVAHFERLDAEFPQHPETVALLNYAADQARVRLRQRAIENVKVEAQRFAAFGQFTDAFAILDAALKDYPGEASLTRLLEILRNRAQERQQYRYQQQVLEEIERCEARGAFQELLRMSALLSPEEIDRHARIREMVQRARVALGYAPERRAAPAIHCLGCGANLPAGVKFCDQCGRPLKAQ